MYPSNEFPVFGVFVKNTETLLAKNNVRTIHKSIIKGRSKGFFKIIGYFKLFFNILVKFYSKKTNLIYVHFPLQTGIIIYILRSFSNKKLVLNIHGSEMNGNIFLKYFLMKNLINSDLIVVPSSFFKYKLVSDFKLDIDKIYVYPSGGIDLNVFKPLDKNFLRKKIGIDASVFVCSYISTISNPKGWKTFFEASVILIKSIENIKFLVVGNGPQERDFKEAVTQYGLNKYYYFYDRQEQKKLVEYYNCSDVFIFPSQSESLGLVALEALACGIPVIAPNKEPFNEYVVDDYNGWLFKLQDANSLANKIVHFMNSGNRKNILKKNAIELAKKYENKFVSDKLANRLKQLI